MSAKRFAGLSFVLLMAAIATGSGRAQEYGSVAISEGRVGPIQRAPFAIFDPEGEKGDRRVLPPCSPL